MLEIQTINHWNALSGTSENAVITGGNKLTNKIKISNKIKLKLNSLFANSLIEKIL